ncbi:MAG: sensor histidine kinase [Bacteroidia bacterium]|nr:sensor histidine kinase [Bacteroidia bacterium]
MKKIYLFLFISPLIFGSYLFSQIKKEDSIRSNNNKHSIIDSLSVLLKKNKEDSNKVILLNTLSWELAYGRDIELALDLAKQALVLSDSIKYAKGKLAAYNALANVYSHNSNQSEALKNYFNALKIAEDINHKPGIANAYNNIGSVYLNTGNIKEASSYLQQSLKISKELDYKKLLSTVYENLGLLNRVQKNYTEAHENHLLSLDIREKLGDPRAIAWSYQNLGIDYASQKNYPLALNYFMKALKLQEELGDKYELCLVLSNISELYFEQKKYKEAVENSERSLTIAYEVNFGQTILQMEMLLSEIYEITGNTKEALKHYKKYTVAKDSIQNEENTKKIVRAEMNYKFEKKMQEERAFQEKQKELADKELKYQKVISWSGITASILIILIAIILIYGYKRKIKTNSFIALQEEEIARQKAGIEGQELERERIAKELHDGLGGTLAGIKLKLEKINIKKTESVTELGNIIDLVSDSCKEVRTISHNLSPPSISNLLLTDALELLTRKFHNPNFLNIQLECFNKEGINAVNSEIKNNIYRIVQECINNIIKHAEAKTIRIDIFKEESYLFLSIEDDGKGFDAKQIKEGIGLKNITSRVQFLKGDITIDSKVKRGTAINIKISV